MFPSWSSFMSFLTVIFKSSSVFLMYRTIFDVLCLTPGPNWKTVFTLSFVTQAKEVLINK